VGDDDTDTHDGADTDQPSGDDSPVIGD